MLVLRSKGEDCQSCTASAALQERVVLMALATTCLLNACRYRSADRKNYQLIEHLIRKGTVPQGTQLLPIPLNGHA